MTFLLTMIDRDFFSFLFFLSPLFKDREGNRKKKGLLFTCCVDSFQICDIFYRYIDTETLVQHLSDIDMTVHRPFSGKNKYVRLSYSG